MKAILPFYLALVTIGLVGLTGCSNSNTKPDASGTFEATEVIVSAESSGPLLQYSVHEGDTLRAGQLVAHIDDVQLQLRKKQLQTQVAAVLSKQPDEASQLATVQEQLSVARREHKRFSELLSKGATTQKVVDDLDGQIRVLEKQYAALQSTLSITTHGLHADTQPLLAQIDQLSDQIARCNVVNPINGTVLATYTEEHEMAVPGKAMYKIADLSTLNLRAYIGGAQLSQIKLGQNVRVFVDDGSEKMRELTGTVTWISSKSEFTPKTIQTKDERANLVYALKVAVKNDGYLKLGMYGEIRL